MPGYSDDPSRYRRLALAFAARADATRDSNLQAKFTCLSSREAGKALIFTPVRESSGESRLNTSGHTLAPSGDSEKAANDQRCP
jgi:hypothetical protein